MLRQYRLNIDRSDGFLVWIEIEKDADGIHISDVSKEILGKIRDMDAGRSRVWGVVFGHLELKPLYSEIFSFGVETLYEVHDRKLTDFHPEAYADNIARIIIRTEPATVLFGATARGRELAPRVAARLQTGLVADCTDLSSEDRVLTMARSEFGGSILTTVRCSTFPQMATVRPGAFPLPELVPGARGTVIYWQNTCPVLKDIVSSDPADGLSEAKIVIALGAGVSGPSVRLAQDIANAWGASIVFSRELTEKEGRDMSYQADITSKSAVPEIYLAFGVSGAPQYMAGIRYAKKIIAVNKDPDAPISQIADEVIVGDADAILAELHRSVVRIRSGTYIYFRRNQPS